MPTIITKRKHRLRVKEWSVPISTDKILGDGIDVTSMPDAHMSCTQCGKNAFEVWVYGSNHRIEIGCMKCGWSARLLLPMDIDLSKRFSEGKFTCFKHPNGGFIIIKNQETVCIGCEYCKTQVLLNVTTKQNLLLVN